MKTEIVKVHGKSIECPFENETHYVAIKSICKALDIDHQKQFDRIKNDPILKDAYTHTVYASDSSGSRKQQMLCLKLEYVFGWLFSIDDSKVNAKAKPGFIQFKKECYHALYEHFYLRSALYERKERMIAEKKLAIQEVEIQINKSKTDLKGLQGELVEIQEMPVTQLKMEFSAN